MQSNNNAGGGEGAGEGGQMWNNYVKSANRKKFKYTDICRGWNVFQSRGGNQLQSSILAINY